MEQFYIFNHSFGKFKEKNATIVFLIQKVNLQSKQLILSLNSQLRKYYENFSQPDKLIFIYGDYNNEFEKIIKKNISEICDVIPLVENNTFKSNIIFHSYNTNGEIKDITLNDDPKNKIILKMDVILNKGLTKIFKERNGIVEAPDESVHFEFPSGKHSNKFLRVANVLLYSSEIYFIAFCLFRNLKGKKYKKIYCDTSSINPIAFALKDIFYWSDNNYLLEYISSFSSYDGLHKDNNLSISRESLVLISASTSGSIIKRIKNVHNQIPESNIKILFYLDTKKDNIFDNHHIICDLTKDIKGEFKQFNQDEKCSLCENGSLAIKISGDNFQIEQPKINKIVIDKKDINFDELNPFINKFISLKENKHSFVRVNYEKSNLNSKKNYEIYFDFNLIMNQINHKQLNDFKLKLDHFINQYIPANLKLVIHLNDESSKKLSEYILNEISFIKPEIVSQDFFAKNITKYNNYKGSVVIVGSCITNGKNLLYLSRALRDINLRIIYFIGINRYEKKDLNKRLISNLTNGRYGKDNSVFVNIEEVNISNQKQSSWSEEKLFLNKIEIDKENLIYKRKEFLNSIIDNGINQNIFYSNLKDKELSIQKNSIFFQSDNYHKKCSQSDVYFVISHVINKLRDSKDINRQLIQYHYVRNIICPTNFYRFNDGIIQASIIRAAKKEELNYKLDFDASKEMFEMISKMLESPKDSTSEALLEFLFALAVGKIQLKIEHAKLIIELCNKTKINIIKEFGQLIKNSIEVNDDSTESSPYY